MTEADKIWVLKNKDKVKKALFEWKNRNPWRCGYDNAKRRTNGKDSKYGKRGIKFSMTIEEFKFLWFRDKAYLMERPSIDRINTGGDYVLCNCRYIEFKDNANRPKSIRTDSKRS